jgi:putative Holliday junction resolvase
VRVLGIDYGERRIGLAASDETGTFAFPAGVIERGKPGSDLAALREVVAERGIEQVVIGLPLHLSGREGEAAVAARAFATRIERELGLPVDTIDERFTTVEAERALREQGVSGKRGKRRRKQLVDTTAATLLLRSWLERRSGATR